MDQPTSFASRYVNNYARVFGGFVDCHRHLDRDGSMSVMDADLRARALSRRHTLGEKWALTDEIKQRPFYLRTMMDRAIHAIELMRHQGVVACRTYVDVDEIVGLEPLEKLLLVRESYRDEDFAIQIALYPFRGFENEKALQVFEQGLHYEGIDCIGVLPSRGRLSVSDYETTRRNMERAFRYAMEFDKLLDFQIDQDNDPDEEESRILIEVTKEFRVLGYTHPITATHCVSLAAQFESDIRRIARDFQELDIYVVVCPSAALNTRRARHKEGIVKIAPLHNSIAPVKELREAGVTVGFGIDNRDDHYMSETTGNVVEELMKFYSATYGEIDYDALVGIATVNGMKILGL